jgi:hypothetical protein
VRFTNSEGAPQGVGQAVRARDCDLPKEKKKLGFHYIWNTHIILPKEKRSCKREEDSAPKNKSAKRQQLLLYASIIVKTR